jgi:membrane protein
MPDVIPNTFYQRVHDWVWRREPRTRAARLALHLARYALALTRDLLEGEISLHAMSLVYTTLLSLVPLLALAFSVLKAFGVHNSLEPVLLQMLQPLGDQAQELTRNIVGFVDRMRVGVLGSVGIVLLLYTAVSMVSKIEASFNHIWKIGRTRGFTQRFSEYLLVLMVGPVLVFTALGLTASLRNSALVARLMNIEPFGSLIVLLTKSVPYLLIVAVLTFMYSFIPNTRVRLKAAAIGGLCAGIAWQSAAVLFTSVVVKAGGYNAIYSGFAIVIFLLLWIYLGWTIILFGCRLAFYVQHPGYLEGRPEPPAPGCREAEALALRVMAAVGERFLEGGVPYRFEELQRQLAVPAAWLERTVALLVGAQLLAETAAERRLLPARDLASFDLVQLWLSARGEHRDTAAGDRHERRARAWLAALEKHVVERGATSLREWLVAGGGKG